ncbi:MAG: hypothetical protein ACW98K_06500 [Candidatus Kariarchaeaceae archaeon]|jgi:hypothetical protein
MQVTSIGGKILLFDYDGVINSSKIFCPLSNTKGKRLLRKTLANHLDPKYWNMIIEPGYYFCPNSGCPVIYYNRDYNVICSLSEIRTPVMHKMEIGNDNRPICYCKNVLESSIIEELAVKKCCDSLKDIQKFTEANTGKDCVITNPTGRCCGKQVKEIMEWVKSNGDLMIDVPLIEEAMLCCAKIEEVSEKTEY